MRNDPHDKFHAYAAQKQPWIDQAILALGADVCTEEERRARIAIALQGAYLAGREQTPEPELVDWHKHLHNKYVKPHYDLMRQAGQTVPEDDPPRPRRIIRRIP